MATVLFIAHLVQLKSQLPILRNFFLHVFSLSLFFRLLKTKINKIIDEKEVPDECDATVEKEEEVCIFFSNFCTKSVFKGRTTQY